MQTVRTKPFVAVTKLCQKGNNNLLKCEGGVITNRDSAYPSSQTLNKLPTMERDKAQNTIDQGKGSAGVITDAASAKADATTAEPSPTAANMPTGATGERMEMHENTIGGSGRWEGSLSKGGCRNGLMR